MKQAAACSRTWEVEAARDGRLPGAALHRFAEHLQQCVGCAREARRLEGLAGRLQAIPIAELDDVSFRRLRSRVLEGVDAKISGRGGEGSGRRKTIAAFCAACMAAAAMAATSVRRVPKQAAVPDSPSVRALDPSGSRWTRRSEGAVEWVDLAEGTLRLSTRGSPSARHLVVHVPDGVIEDVGTIFVVTVRDGHAERVSVEEGSVTIRLANEAPQTLTAGQRWERTLERPALASAPIEPAQPAPATASRAPGPVRQGGSRPGASPPVASTGPGHVPGMTGALLLAPPADAADENAAYLEVVGRARAQDAAGARAAAQGYLRRFPNGFRREEVGRFVRP